MLNQIYIEEIWKDIKSYEGRYQVSNLGKVKSLVRECILKFGIRGKGYLYVNLCKDGQVKKFSIHRLVAETFIPNPDNKPEVNHRDGIKNHNEATNLEWATSKENIEHAMKELGRIGPRGEIQGNSKLTEADVIQIRESKLRLKDLAYIYKVSIPHLSDIKNHKKWGHVLCLE